MVRGIGLKPRPTAYAYACVYTLISYSYMLIVSSKGDLEFTICIINKLNYVLNYLYSPIVDYTYR